MTIVRNLITEFAQSATHDLDLPPNLTVDGGIDRNYGYWKKYMPFSPREAYDLLTEDLPADIFVRMSLNQHGDVRIKMVKMEDGDSVISDDRSLYLGDGAPKSINPGDLYVSERFRGQLIGRKALRNQIEFGLACGAQQVKMTASGITGSYLWAEAGFDCDISKDPNLCADLTQRLVRLNDAINIPDNVYDSLSEEIENPRADIMRRIVAYNSDITDLLRARKNLGVVYEDCYASLKDIHQNCRTKNGCVPIGRAVLYHFTWTATADLKQPSDFERLDKYFGFKHFKYEREPELASPDTLSAQQPA